MWSSPPPPKLDNKASVTLQQFMDLRDIDFQLAPPNMHHPKVQKSLHCRIVQHQPQFPLHLWDWLLPHALISLNLLPGSRINPRLSTCAQVHSTFNYRHTSLAPPGTHVYVNEKPGSHGTCTPHTIPGFYQVSINIIATECGFQRLLLSILPTPLRDSHHKLPCLPSHLLMLPLPPPPATSLIILY